MRVDELMSSPVYSVRPDLSPKQVSRLLVEHGVGCAPVVDAGGVLIGMVTEADLMRLQLHRDPTRHQRRDREDATAPPPATVGELMTCEVVAVPVDFDVADAARLMLDRYLTRLPVVEGEQLVGILSRTDLLRVLVRDDVKIAQDVAARLAELPGGWTVEADAGVLTLRGNRRPGTERLARTVAWGVPGVVGCTSRGEPTVPSPGGRADPRGPAAAEGTPAATVTLTCRHRLTRYFADHPQALPGFSIRCPTCHALRPVWLVTTAATGSGWARSEHTGTGARRQILIVDGDQPCRPEGGGEDGRPSDDGCPAAAWWEQV